MKVIDVSVVVIPIWTARRMWYHQRVLQCWQHIEAHQMAAVVDTAHQSVIEIISLHGWRRFDFINTLNAWQISHGMRSVITIVVVAVAVAVKSTWKSLSLCKIWSELMQ